MSADGLVKRRCMAAHPSDGYYCAVPVPDGDLEHQGPHGWDRESGEMALITRRQFSEELAAVDLSLADRFDWLLGKQGEER